MIEFIIILNNSFVMLMFFYFSSLKPFVIALELIVIKERLIMTILLDLDQFRWNSNNKTTYLSNNWLKKCFTT